MLAVLEKKTQPCFVTQNTQTNILIKGHVPLIISSRSVNSTRVNPDVRHFEFYFFFFFFYQYRIKTRILSLYFLAKMVHHSILLKESLIYWIKLSQRVFAFLYCENKVKNKAKSAAKLIYLFIYLSIYAITVIPT